MGVVNTWFAKQIENIGTFAPKIGTTSTTALAGDTPVTSAAIPLTGYVIDATGGEAVAATDTINEAIGKLEKRIADLEAV